MAVYDFDGGTGFILLDNVQCTGNESSLSQCPHDGIGIHDCDHSEDAGVKCLSGKDSCMCPYSINYILIEYTQK